MIAIKRLQSIMWILIVAMGALSAYLISLRVATERHAVQAVEQRIYATRTNIRYLEVEFSARSSMRQLQSWNASSTLLSVPKAGQYLASERQLAALDRIAPVGAPSRAGAPVMAAMAQAAVVQPVAAPSAAPHAVPASEFALIGTAKAAEPARQPLAKAVKSSPETVVDNQRAMRLALLDQTLLDATGTARTIN